MYVLITMMVLIVFFSILLLLHLLLLYYFFFVFVYFYFIFSSIVCSAQHRSKFISCVHLNDEHEYRIIMLYYFIYSRYKLSEIWFKIGNNFRSNDYQEYVSDIGLIFFLSPFLMIYEFHLIKCIKWNETDIIHGVFECYNICLSNDWLKFMRIFHHCVFFFRAKIYQLIDFQFIKDMPWIARVLFQLLSFPFKFKSFFWFIGFYSIFCLIWNYYIAQ